MATAVITGSAGLVGAEAVRSFAADGYDVVGIDNDMRRVFFGDEASTAWSRRRLEAALPRYRHHAVDIRDDAEIGRIFGRLGRDIEVVIHAAAQPSHDWAARDPLTDFSVNAVGTQVLLEATRKHCPDAAFVYCSTNKVYGDVPNRLPFVELPTRWEVDAAHPFFEHGIDESMSIDQSDHSLFGVSKTAADLLVQEYGRAFGMQTGVFRGGCITGGGHSGTELHGFLSYLMRCGIEERPYVVYGYQGRQVRDNIHAHDLVAMFRHYCRAPRPGEVYNAGGGRHCNCSLQEAITLCERVSGKSFRAEYRDAIRRGDHRWYLSDVRKFRAHYPLWDYQYDLAAILNEIHAGWLERAELPRAKQP
jgi:CDP-paratose 2-epimerase